MKTIMIIEDDFETQLLFSELLRSENFEVVAMSHGKDALKHIQEGNLPDLIFMDLNFPFMTPEEFTDGLRTVPGGDKTHVILVSGKANIEDYAKKLNATNFIKKPFEIDYLLDMVHKTI